MMERLGIPLERGSLFGWSNVLNWARHLGQGSYVFAAKHKEEAAYMSQLHIAAQLADLYDMLNLFRYGFAKTHRTPEPYPRPWDGKQKIGRGAIPVSDFDKWYYGES